MKKIIFILSVSALILSGCNNDNTGDPKMGLDKEELSFDRQGNPLSESRTVNVISNCDYIVSSDKDWCVVNPLSVRGNTTITVNVSENKDFTERTATVSLISKTLPQPKIFIVKQSRNDYTVGVTPVELNFDFEGNPGSTGNIFNINSNSDWEVIYTNPTDEQWCVLSAKSGSGNASVTVNLPINKNAAEPRSAKLKVKVGDQESTVSVNQENCSELALSLITDFTVPIYSLKVVIDNDAKTIVMTYVNEYTNIVAEVKLSTWATISPDPATARSYETPVKFTVTSYDGTSTTEYTVSKRIPPRRAKGIRPGSGTLVWEKKLKDDLGITTTLLTGGIAVTKDHVVLNTRNAASVYVDRFTGAKLGAIDLGVDFTGGVRNFYNTADDNGNVLICNLTKNDGNTFKIFKLVGTAGPAQEFIAWDGEGKVLGRKISVRGSIDGDAIITAPIISLDKSFARWQVRGGNLVSQTPVVVTITPTATYPYSGWAKPHVDVVYSSATDISADYFVISYSTKVATWTDGADYTVLEGLTWVNGATNTIKSQQGYYSSNYIPNAVDYVMFNKNPYVTFNYLNQYGDLSWAHADHAVVVDAGNESTFVTPNNLWGLPADTHPAIVFISPQDIHGSLHVEGIANGNVTGDVQFKVSDDGNYLHLYLMISGGCVACYKFDCFDETEM